MNTTDPANRPWREYMEHEAREADRADREFASRRMCGPRAVSGVPERLPSLTEQQIVSSAATLYGVLVDLLDAVEQHNAGAYTARISRAWCRGRSEIKRAAETEAGNGGHVE